MSRDERLALVHEPATLPATVRRSHGVLTEERKRDRGRTLEIEVLEGASPENHAAVLLTGKDDRAKPR